MIKREAIFITIEELEQIGVANGIIKPDDFYFGKEFGYDGEAMLYHVTPVALESSINCNTGVNDVLDQMASMGILEKGLYVVIPEKINDYLTKN